MVDTAANMINNGSIVFSLNNLILSVNLILITLSNGITCVFEAGRLKPKCHFSCIIHEMATDRIMPYNRRDFFRHFYQSLFFIILVKYLDQRFMASLI